MDNEQNEHSTWIERVKDLITMLEGSSISEMELTEAGTEIIIRRQPGMMMVSVPQQQVSIVQAEAGSLDTPAASSPFPGRPSATPAARPAREDRSVPIVAPLTGVYYSSPSPASPPFISPG